jgi:hypothetical protein
VTDEDGVDVVEAIDAWIDEQIDDLTDDELEIILEILDAVSASSLANVEADAIYDDDIDQLVELAGGSRDDRAYANLVLRAVVFDEPFDEVAPDEPGGRDRNQDSEPEAEAADLDEYADDSDTGEDDLNPVGEDSSDDEPGVGSDGAKPEPDSFLGNDTDENQPHGGFLSDLADAQTLALRVGEIDDVGHPPVLAEPKSPNGESNAVALVELRDYDELGPSFLTEPRGSNRRRHGFSAILLPALVIIGLAIFGFGMLQLLTSLDEDDADSNIAVNTEQQDKPPTAAPESAPAPTSVAATPALVDPVAPPRAPAPEPTPAPRIGIRLATGDVMLASFPDSSGIPEISQLYDASDDDLSPASEVAWLPAGVGIVDNDGNVLIVDPDARWPRPIVIYQAGGDFGEAVEIAPIKDGLVAVRTNDGDISLTPSNGRADPAVIQVVWDADEEDAKATDLSSVDKLVPFVLDNGNAQMIVTSADNVVVPIWVADERPPAFNVAGSDSGILLGVGQGAVERYTLGEVGSNQLVSVWDPFTRGDEPAVGYSSVGDSTVIVTGNGAIVLADDSGGGPLLWDPETTQLRALIALGTEARVVALLETGSVIRIPIDPDQLIDSIWDMTDETLSPANQVVVEPASS